MSELKPCPFCGGEIKLLTDPLDVEGEYCQWEHKKPNGICIGDDDVWNKKNFIEFWNTRADTSVKEALRESAEAYAKQFAREIFKEVARKLAEETIEAMKGEK